MAKKMGSSPSSRACRPRRSAAPSSAARCSRCRTPTRRSPTAASTTTRPRSRRSSFPNGEVDEAEDPEGDRVISDGVAYKVADVMKGALEYGTAAGHGIGCPASGKTGTTEEQSDAWFVGYTPKVSTAVWTGNPISRTPLPGYGADLATPIWHDYMLATIEQVRLRRLPGARGPRLAVRLLRRLEHQQLDHRHDDDPDDRRRHRRRPAGRRHRRRRRRLPGRGVRPRRRPGARSGSITPQRKAVAKDGRLQDLPSSSTQRSEETGREAEHLLGVI